MSMVSFRELRVPDSIRLVVALPSEAAPIIQALRLRRVTEAGGLRHYHGPGLDLVISGVGKLHAACAVGWLQARTRSERCGGAWINLGLAGHGGLEPGDWWWPARVIDQASGHWWRLQTAEPAGAAGGELLTLDQPGRDYQPTLGFDNEAAGFAAAVRRFDRNIPLYVLKVVADSPRHPLEEINPALAARLMNHLISPLRHLLATKDWPGMTI